MLSQSKNAGKLYLIPSYIGDPKTEFLPKQVIDVCQRLDYFLAENIRTARRFLSSLQADIKIDTVHFQVLDKDTEPESLKHLMSPLFDGHNIGIISEAGCPGIADPGAMAVAFAHQYQLQVIPLTGPSSILLALMASGFNGQNFCFHGYLPIEKKSRARTILQLEKNSSQYNTTQIFMETPYRNQKLLNELLSNCKPGTFLCLARDIQGPDEFIKTLTIGEWQQNVPDLHKKPTIFLLSSA